eukprot:Nk52_evm7s374 gene=Nk52_evmTU7s374
MVMDQSIAGLLDEWIDKGFGDKVAINYFGKTQTFSEQRKVCTNIAAHFQRLSPVGEPIGLLLRDGLEIFATYLACYKSGTINVPINPRNSAREVTNVLAQSTPKVLVIHESRLDCLNKVDLDHTNVDVVLVFGKWDNFSPSTKREVKKCESFEQLLQERGDGRVACLPFEHVLQNTAGLDFTPMPEVTEDSYSLIMFTSGSTGNPKGVLHTQKNMRHGNVWFRECMGFEQGSANDKSICLTCVASEHSSGVWTHAAMLYLGMTWYFVGSVSCEKFVEAVNEYCPTHILGLTAQFQMMITSPKLKEEALKNVRIGVAGGDTVTSTLKETFYKKTGAVLVILYGSTESSVNSINMDKDPKNLSIGLPTDGCDVKILNHETGEEVPDGTVGEMLVKYPAMFVKYFNNPEATEKALTKDGYYKTGDLVCRKPNGYMDFCGRIKHMIKYKTLTIYASDVEEAVLTHPHVRECAAVGKDDKDYGELPCCFVSPKDDPETHKPFDISEEKLLSYLGNDMLADYKIPRKIVVMDELPKGKTGKIDRLLMKKLINGEEGVIPLDVAFTKKASGLV